jgi:hypothetical protein
MVPEDLLFWIVPINESPITEPSLLCLRHADAMVVPRGWTLDDRRQHSPQLFNTRALPRQQTPTPKPKRRRPHPSVEPAHEQMQIDGTGEISRPVAPIPVSDPEPWQPDFDEQDDLGGLLHVESPLLARAFRGTDRPKR